MLVNQLRNHCWVGIFKPGFREPSPLTGGINAKHDKPTVRICEGYECFNYSALNLLCNIRTERSRDFPFEVLRFTRFESQTLQQRLRCIERIDSVSKMTQRFQLRPSSRLAARLHRKVELIRSRLTK